MSQIKTDRNLQILLAKEGKDKIDGEIVRDKVSYRELSNIFNLSIPRLLFIIKRERNRYRLTGDIDT